MHNARTSIACVVCTAKAPNSVCMYMHEYTTPLCGVHTRSLYDYCIYAFLMMKENIIHLIMQHFFRMNYAW